MPKIKVTSIRSDHQILATSGWHSKKRRKIDTNCEYSIREESLLPAKNQGNVEDSTLHTLLSPTDSTRRSNGSRENPIPTENLEDLSKVGQIDKREEHSPSLQRLHGTAVLAILPDKSVGGHLITSHGAFGLIGREVLSFRECTRDADWSVLRLTLIDFDNNGREVSFLAEKTGSDAMSLSSPVKWEGTEEENEKSLGSGCEAGMMLAFKCETIFSSEAADRILSLLMPKLSEQGLIVNQGAYEHRYSCFETYGAEDGQLKNLSLCEREEASHCWRGWEKLLDPSSDINAPKGQFNSHIYLSKIHN